MLEVFGAIIEFLVALLASYFVGTKIGKEQLGINKSDK